MGDGRRVAWSRGMFVLPQHFQQHDRYMENLVNSRCMGGQLYDWGFYSLGIDQHLLRIGKLGLTECRGIFPDGTPFSLPEDDELPLPLDVPEDVNDEMFFLSLPARRREGVETDSERNPESLARFRIGECEVRDCNSGTEGRVPLQVCKLKTRLLLQREERAGYTCLGVGRVVETGANRHVELDGSYIPPNLNCAAMPNLGAFVRELHGILNTRGEMLAIDLVKPSHMNVEEISDFLMLQMINRYQTLFKHLCGVEGLHPEEFYRVAVQLAGELSTFFRDGRRPINFPQYDHDDLRSTFSPLMEELRDLLAKDRMRRAVRIPLSKPKAGVYGARIPDVHLLDNAIFILAAKAQIASEVLRSNFHPQVKIGPVEEIQQLVSSHLRGIAIEPLPVAPKELPYHTGFTYFELDRYGEYWKRMKTSGGFAIWIGGDFRELELEFWAIKEA